jgi:nucleoside-diphosphate-sugar epimerase
MDYLGLPFASTNLHTLYALIDLQSLKSVLPGDGNCHVVFTHTRDVGKLLTRLLDLDFSKWPREATISGDRITLNELVDLAEEVTGENP